MSDNHFCYIHMTDEELRMLDDVEDADLLKMPLPDEDIEVPPGMVPPLQEEENDSILPMTSHPSYPYGNPYTISLLPLRPSARSTNKGNPHTRHIHTWTDLALEDLLPWEGEEPDLNYFAGLEAEAAAAAHAAAAAAAAAAPAGEGEGETANQTGQEFAEMAEDGEALANSEEGDDTTDASEA